MSEKFEQWWKVYGCDSSAFVRGWKSLYVQKAWDYQQARIAELENDRNAWRESAEQLGRQIASLTHKIPTDIPLQESRDE